MHFNVIIFILFFAVPLLLLQHVPTFLFSITHQTFDILFYLCVFKKGTVSDHGSEGYVR